MAGIWETWKDTEGRPINSFSIITTTPNALMEKLHNRMPVILSPENENVWLNENDVETLKNLLVPFEAEMMEAYPVSSKVNSPANNNEEVIEQLDKIGGQQSIF
jgi:putative SOS response-associated peptidase YedK